MSDQIFLVGLSGSGKSTVGRLLADRLGWSFVDSDTLIEKTAGRSIPAIFSEEGEAAFRKLEGRALARATRSSEVVVATGGGAPTHDAGRQILADGFTVWLAVSPAIAAERLAAQPTDEPRPLLAGDPRERLESLLESRRDDYARADASIEVDGLTAEQVCDQIVRLWEGDGSGDGDAIPGVAATVTTPGASYPIVVREGALADLGDFCTRVGLSGRAFVLTDTGSGPLFAATALDSLRAAGFQAADMAIPAGEEHKTLATAQTVYDWLLGERVERSDFLVCLGGGVVTDLGGFAAATVLRGIPFVHVPTTLLGMVDAAIGGKTGVDHAIGKNLVGAFAQPRLVLTDPALLATLPPRHLHGGLAELVKHGFILDEELVQLLEARAGDPAALATEELIARSTAIKARVVSEDEREAGARTLLNYGHTIGHGIEAAAGFSGYLHGEAVAIGMHAAGRIACETGLLPAAALERQQSLLRACGLPERAEGVDREAVVTAMRSDKKVRAGEISWVLLERIGQAAVYRDVPETAVEAALDAVLA
ncbi:MAG: 3-dehydroquinate synthase [Chloroflexi bacterium]|nr:3-dehydroquinate synthase [Chloroflexota bacterium]